MSRTIILYIFVAIARLSILANSRMLKLTYFGFPGRAYAIRTALRIGGVAFEDEIIDFNYLNANKPSSPTIPLGSVPVLTVSFVAQLLKVIFHIMNFDLFVSCRQEK